MLFGLLLLILVFNGLAFDPEEWINDPLFPTIESVESNPHYQTLFKFNKPNDTMIPRNAWIATRGDKPTPGNILDMINENPDWKFNVCGNDCKDEFMNKIFRNTSVGWAYNIINPDIGAAKAEIWRLCVLYVYGGMFLDDDSYVGQKLNNIVQKDDQFIISPEVHGLWNDQCYEDKYVLSNHSFTQRFGELNTRVFQKGHYLLNWIIFSKPFHKIIERSLQHAVELIKGEYNGESHIRVLKHEHRGKLMLCATCFPITLSIRELLLEDLQNITKKSTTPIDHNSVDETELNEHLGLRIVKSEFAEYGGKMKAWYGDWKPDHWLHVMARQATYLRSYRIAPFIEKLEGNILASPGTGKRIFIVRNATRYFIPNVDTFIKLKLDFSEVKTIPTQELELIPYGGEISVD